MTKPCSLDHRCYTSEPQILISNTRKALEICTGNVYMPCVGTINRSLIYEEILNNLELWMREYPNHTVVIGGDINLDLDNVNSISEIVNRFIVDNCLQRCDTLYGANTKRRT